MNIIKELYWKEFFINYLNDNLYWYIPKGYAIKSDNFESIKNKREEKLSDEIKEEEKENKFEKETSKKTKKQTNKDEE